MTAEVVQKSLLNILEAISQAVSHTTSTKRCRLVAVSKTKSAELVAACYSQGQLHFGENYVQELEEKSEILKETCPSIRWHFIGQVQSNKVSKICTSPGLYCVETLGSEKHASLFDKEWAKRGDDSKLRVLVQVNTSGEENKGGLNPVGAMKLAEFVRSQCAHLLFNGFMTIGSVESSHSSGLNPDFESLFKTRQKWAAETGESEDSVELSMGMSDDFEAAIAQGSTSVRVGSKIFGARVYNKP